MTFEEALRLAHKTDYRCTDEEYALMWKSIIDVPVDGPLCVIEIGSFVGASSTIMGLAAKERGWPLICYDAWATHEQFTDKSEYEMCHSETDNCKVFNRWINQMTQVGLYPSHVVPIVGDSAMNGALVAPTCKCAVCLVDGGHKDPQPILDISVFKPMVCTDGLMLIHDADRRDVNVSIIMTLQIDPKWQAVQAWAGYQNRIEVYKKRQ